jgi:hypothetical protein
MTGMSPTRRPRLLHRDGRTAVYQAQAATKEPIWHDLVAGAVFFVSLLIFVAVVLAGGLLVFG